MTSAAVAPRCVAAKPVRRRREGYLAVDLAPEGNEEHALTHLWYAVKGRVQERVAADVALLFENLADLLGDVLAAVVENVRHVLNEDGQGLADVDPPQVFLVESRARVVPKRLRMRVDLAEQASRAAP